MAKMGTLALLDSDGNEYSFDIYPFGTKFKAISTIYYISKRTKDKDDSGHSHSHIYIGQTSDIAERFENHHKAECFTKNKANCISIHQVKKESERLKIEKALIEEYSPVCNG